MKKLSLFFILLLVLPTSLLAQYSGATGRGDILNSRIGVVLSRPITVSGSTGANGNYGSLTGASGAFAAINATAQTGNNIVITINGSVSSETGTTSLNAGAWSSILIYPTVAGITLSGNVAGAMINLNGADNVTLDGSLNANGANQDLTIDNTSTSASAGTSTIRFINDATSNTIKYCNLKGATTDAASGIVFFSTTTVTTGNDGNLIDNNNITGSTVANRPINAIYSAGTAAKENSTNTISNNDIYNFFRTGSSSYGIQLYANTTDFTITRNSFYENTLFIPTGAYTYQMVAISNTSGNNFQITSNYFGGRAALCAGAALSMGYTGTVQSIIFQPIYLNVGSSVVTSIQGNTIKSIAESSSNTEPFRAINAVAGLLNIGTLTGNTLGATNTTGSIIINGTVNNTNAYGIYISSTSTVNCQLNNIGSITTSNTTSTYATNFSGIYKASGIGTTNMSNNLIGSTTTANSINTSCLATASSQLLYGIYSAGTGSTTISNNTVANLTNSTTETIYLSELRGILTVGGSNAILANNVHHLKTSGAASGENYHLTSLLGISQICKTAGTTQNVSDNNVNNLTHTATVKTEMYGIFYDGPESGTNTISRNFVHSFYVVTTDGAYLHGISQYDGAFTSSNNIVYLGNTITTGCSMWAMWTNSNDAIRIYHNTLYLAGTATTGTSRTYAFRSLNTNPTDGIIKNNILWNGRTSTNAINHYAIYLDAGTNYTVDYNDYRFAQNFGVVGANTYATFATWKAGTPFDDNSTETNPMLVNLGGTLASDYQTTVPLDGVPGTGILTDYNEIVRSLTAPTMGAWEFFSKPVEVWNGNTFRGSYNTLKEAFDKINDGTWTGDLNIRLTGNTTETATAKLNASGTGGANYTNLLIYPARFGVTVSGSLAAPLIDLNGCDNVTIDGRKGAVGSTPELTLINTSALATAGTSTIRFNNDASNNTVKYCNIKGSAGGQTNGIVLFGTTTGTTGNDGNTITYNNITNAADANRPYNAIYSLGTVGFDNSGNTISNNNIYNVLNRGVATDVIHIDANNTAWTISGNSIYETTSFVPSAAGAYKAIYINNTSGSGFTVSGNYIGGTAAQCGGSAFTKTNANNNLFTAIDLNVGTAAASNIQGNVIQNFAWSNSAAANWTGINANNGTINIGTTVGNTIGATTGNGSITYTCAAAGADFYGINIASTGTIDCQNNNIGAITVANAAANSTNFYGINKTAGPGTTTISYNNIGSSSTANSIYASSASTGAAQTVYGISNAGTGVITIDNNAIARLTNGTTNTTVATMGRINGIVSIDGTNIISDNNINNLTIANANTLATFAASVCGIALSGSTLKTVTGNTINNLSNTYASFAGNVIGLCFTGNTGANDVSRNFIHSLSVNSSSTTATLYGIKVAAGATTYANNIISLGGNTRTAVYGFFETGAAGNNNSYYYNTVYLGGSLSSGSTNKSYAFFSAVNTNTRILMNNVFVNARSTSGSSNMHYAIYFNQTAGTFTSNYNDFFTSGTGGVMGYYSANRTTIAAWRTATGQDANSLQSNPNFIVPGSTVATDYKTGIDLLAYNGTGITVDHGLNPRYSSPCMGAWERIINRWKGTTSTNWGTASNWTANYVPAADANIIFDPLPLRDCIQDIDRSVGSIINTTAYRVITNGRKLTVKGDFIFSGGAKIVASSTNSTVEFAGSFDQSIPTGAFLNNEVYNLTVNNPNDVVLYGTLRLLNLLTATSGRLDAITNTSTLVYAGTTNQTIGNYLFLNDQLYNLTIDNGAGVFLTSTNVTTVQNNFTINAAKKFIINPRAKLTVVATTTNYADTSGFRIRSTAAGTGSFIEATAGVKATVERYFWGPETQFHYCSSPLTSCLSMVFHYAWLYSWTETTQTWFNIVPTNIPIIPLVGYSARLKHIDPIKNPGTPPNNPVLFAGTLNTAQMSKSLTYTSGSDPGLNGFNLVGNPYPSGIDWDAPTGWTKTFVNNAIYYWSVSQYASYVNGVGVNGGSRYIGNGQAFFATSAGRTGTLIMNNNVRTHDSASLFRASINNILRFKVENGNMADEAVIRFTDGASSNFDYDFDAYKLIADNEMPQLYTRTENGILASINSLAENNIDKTKVPMNIKIRTAGNYKITASSIESFDNLTYLALEDTKTHTTQLLTENPVYSFYADPTDAEGRFIVWFYKNSPNAIAQVSQADVSIYGNNNTITINLNGISSEGAEMSILNMLGQTLDKKQITSDHISNYRTELADGIYIIRVMANGKLFEKKLFLNK